MILIIVFTFFLVRNEMTKTAYIGLDSENLPTVRLQGEGVVRVAPDQAEVSFAVVTEDDESEVAVEENNRRMEEVVEYLKNEGIEEENIRTGDFNVRPMEDWSRDPETGESTRTIHGYRVNNTVEVEITDLEKAGVIMDGAVRAGANRVSRFNMVVSDEEEYKREARQEAIRKAQEKGGQIASDLGVNLGRILSFSEDAARPPMIRAGLEVMEEDDVAPGEVPIEPGESEVRVNVTMEYELR